MKRVLTPRVTFIIVLCHSKLKFVIEVRLIIFTFLQRSFGSEKNDTNFNSVCQFLPKLSYIRSLKF